MGLWGRDSWCLAFISNLGRATIALHALRGPAAQRHRPYRVRGVLAGQRQLAADLLLLHPRGLLHGSPAVRQHILLCYYHQPETLLCAGGTVKHPPALEPEEEEDFLAACGLGTGFRSLLAAPSGQSLTVLSRSYRSS